MTGCRGFTGEPKERTSFATRLSIFQKVNRASGGFKHLTRQHNWWYKFQGLISLQLDALSHVVFLSHPVSGGFLSTAD